MSRILLTAFGSLGDLHPLLAMGFGLRERGHEAVFATNDMYRAKIEALGFEFHGVGPHVSPDDPQIVAYLMDQKKGPERLLREMILPHVRGMYEDLRKALGRGVDLIVSGELAYATPLLAEKTGTPWVSYITAPLSFFSAYDLPVPPQFPALAHLRWLGPRFNRAMVNAGKWMTHSWIEPVRQLRAELGLPPGANPLFEGKFSPHLTLATFSPVLAQPQPDWPANVVITGYTFYDGKQEGAKLPAELEKFLAAGEAPIVFTLGSAAVLDPGRFFEESAKAAMQLNRRAVLIMRKNAPLPALPDSIFACGYVPFSDILPRAAAIVHQGGIGTTGQALRAGRPMLVMPYGFDQPDNADRLVRLGVARTISRKKYSAPRAARELAQLLGDAAYAQRAAEIGRIVQAEDGVRVACDAMDTLLSNHER